MVLVADQWIDLEKFENRKPVAMGQDTASLVFRLIWCRPEVRSGVHEPKCHSGREPHNDYTHPKA
jgi:hypothetical protein